MPRVFTAALSRRNDRLALKNDFPVDLDAQIPAAQGSTVAPRKMDRAKTITTREQDFHLSVEPDYTIALESSLNYGSRSMGEIRQIAGS